MTTTLEIIDTTVKIGLGAIISGVSTYILSHKSFNQTLTKIKLEAKAALVKESALKYEEAIAFLNKCSHETRKRGIENLERLERNEIAEMLTQAKVCMNYAESCARLAGLTELADCYDSYSDGLNELNIIYTENGKIEADKTCKIIDNFGRHWSKIKSLQSKAYDKIFS